MRRIAVVGSGLSGLFAACLAAQAGAEVTVVALGNGGLSLSHAGIELWDSTSPSRSIARLASPHPYALAGGEALRSGLKALHTLVRQNGGKLEGGISSRRTLLTAMGSARHISLAPVGAAVLDQLRDYPAAITVLPGLRDYYPELIALNAVKLGLRLQPLIELPAIDLPQARSYYALDLARRFEDKNWRREITRAWKPKLTGINRIVLPACLGLRSAAAVRSEFEDQLGVRTFEIPLLPPTVPGLRLESALIQALDNLGVMRIEGAAAIGRFDGKTGGKTTSGLVLESAGMRHSLDADAVILATGGVLHGGLLALQEQGARESVYQIPVDGMSGRVHRAAASPFDDQPYARCGIRVNAGMQPLGTDGKPFLENLFAAGGIIAGADRTREGSRQGIDIATAYRAAQSALGLPGRTRKRSSRGKAK